MGNGAWLELAGSTQPYGEDPDEAVATLEANNTLPFFWLALLDEADLQRPEWWEHSTADEPRSWADQVRAAYADPDEDGIPSLELSWTTARQRLRDAVTRSQSRGDAWTGLFEQWVLALEALASRGPTVFVRLDIGGIPNFHSGADEYLERILADIRWWHGQNRVAVPEVNSVAELTGFDVEMESLFSDVTWQPGRASSPPRASTQSKGKELLDWLSVALLSGGTIAALFLTGSVWLSGLVFLLLATGITVLMIRRSARE